MHVGPVGMSSWFRPRWWKKVDRPKHILGIKHPGLDDGLGAEGQGERRVKNKWWRGVPLLKRLVTRRDKVTPQGPQC